MADMILCRDTEEFKCRPFSSLTDMLSLKGKKALVTGAAGGIGTSTASAFAELGADVALMDIPQQEEKLKTVCAGIAEKYGVKAIYVTGDVSCQESVKDFVGKVKEEFGTIDILHNNAGIIMPTDSADTAIEDWRRLLGINLDGIFMVGREVANIMKEAGNGGKIINTASMSGHIYNKTPDHNYGFAYATSKAAVMQLTKGMAANYIKYGINVNSVSPGVILSGIHDPVPAELMQFSLSEIPAGRFGKLDEIAGVVAMLATDVAGFMVGADILVDGGQCIN